MAFKSTIEAPVRLARRSIAVRLNQAMTTPISIDIQARQSGWLHPVIQHSCLSASSFVLDRKRSLPCSAFNSRWFHTTPLRSHSLGKIELKKMPIITHTRNSPSRSNVYNQTDNLGSSDIPSSRPTIWKPFIFCAGLTLFGFGTAVYMTNKDTSSKIDYVFKNQTTFPMWFSKVFSTLPISSEPSDLQLQQLRKLEKLNFIKSTGLNQIIPNHVLTWYINLSEGKQISLVLALANLPIFLLWQLPRMTSYMTSTFTHNPLSGKSHTILTSVFSQASALHFGFNMMALYSIGSTAHDSLTHRFRASRDYDPVRIPESTPTYHFLAFYLFAGLFAGFASHAFSLMIRAPRLLKWRQGTSNTTVVPTPILPSLGASGAIYGCLTMTALAFPDAQVSLIFLPWVPINIGGAVTGAVLFDLMGVIRNWKFFDHAAHLGGALAGVFWHLVIAKWFDVTRLRFWSPKENSVEED